MTVPAVELAPMQRGDVAKVAAIERRVYTMPWSPRLFRDELGRRDAARDRVYVVARRSGSDGVVGYGGLLLVAGDGHVATVAVDPDRQRQGLGTILVLALARAGVEAGCRSLTLEVRPSNEVACRIYRRFGFAPAGMRKRYYTDDGEDALIMWAHDVDRAGYSARLDAIEADLPGPAVWRAA